MTPSDGAWTETVLHAFTGPPDGGIPQGAPIMDAQGNLYGTTAAGGSGSCAGGCGAVFELTPSQSGSSWTETVLHSFAGADGAQPYNGLVADAQGNLYGTTQLGGAYGGGTVFELTPENGVWTEILLYSFTGGADGGHPISQLVFDNAGNLYGTTYAGGSGLRGGRGVVFELTPSQGGSSWTETVLHRFAGKPDGAHSASGLVFDTEGNLYGTTGEGGLRNRGVVFEVSGLRAATTTTLTSSLNPSVHGQAVTFTAVVTSTGPYPPTGKVTFKDGTTAIGTVTLSSSVATLTTSKLAVGTHAITAVYAGDTYNAKDTSQVLDQVVQ